MIGQQQIILARQKGLKPTAVFINAGLPDAPRPSKFDAPEMALHFGLYPTVFVGLDELSKRTDWRFLTGLRVHVHGVEMTDEFVALVDSIAEFAEHTIAIAGDAMIEVQNEGAQAWKF